MKKKGGRVRRILRGATRLGLVAAVVYGLAGFLTSRIGPPPRVVVPPAAGPTLPDAAGFEVWTLERGSPAVASWLEGRGVEVRGAVSVHSGRSHDAEGTFDEIAAAAERAGLDFVILGDHPAPWLQEPGALDPVRLGSVLLVPGQEMVIPETGRVLVVGLDADTLVERWEGEVADLSARVEAVDGYVSVVHARSPRGRERWQAGVDAPGIDAWEVLDVSEVARLRLADRWAGYHMASFLLGLATGTAQGPVLRLNREGASAPGLLAYDSARVRETLTLTGALNHHPKARILGRLVPPYTPFFRTLTNHVLLSRGLDPDPRAARAQLLEGLRAGRTFLSLGDAERAEGFAFGPLPGAASGEGGGLLGVALPPAAEGDFYVRLLRNGREVAWIPVAGGAVLALRPPGPATYRVEVHRAGTSLGSRRFGMRPWILSNALDAGS